jgi:hypothetical protein
LDAIAESARSHLLPLVVHDGAPVADELAGQLARGVGRQELRRLDLLDDHEGLRLSAGPGLVVAREGEEDDEAEQDRESRGEDAEDAGRAIAVGETAALGGRAPHEQHGRHGDRRRRDGDE